MGGMETACGVAGEHFGTLGGYGLYCSHPSQADAMPHDPGSKPGMMRRDTAGMEDRSIGGKPSSLVLRHASSLRCSPGRRLCSQAGQECLTQQSRGPASCLPAAAVVWVSLGAMPPCSAAPAQGYCTQGTAVKAPSSANPKLVLQRTHLRPLLQRLMNSTEGNRVKMISFVSL